MKKERQQMIEGNTGNPVTTNRFTTLIYGESGSGKTTFCTTMPKPYLIVTERVPQGFDAQERKVPYVKVETFEEFMSVLDEVIAKRRAADAESICIDSLTEMTPLITNYLLRKHNKERMTLELWGIAVDHLRTSIRRFLTEVSKRAYTCVTALQEVSKDEYTGEIIGGVDTIGKFSGQVPAFFDLTLYTRQKTAYNPTTQKSEPAWCLTCVKYGRFPAKDGLGFLLAEEPVDFSNLLTKYNIRKDALKQKEAVK
jgi:hypothetical protein